MTDIELMQSIKTKWGDLLESVASMSTIQAPFLAALIANESGGDPNATRFEPAVFSALGEVLMGRKAAYGSIGAQDVLLFVVPAAIPQDGSGNIRPGGDATPALRTLFSSQVQRLASLAASWGLTQVMGYEAIAFRTDDGVQALQSPVSEMTITVKMLTSFAFHNQLDVTKDFSELFDCWNTGRPHAPTADPQYIPNGLARLALYAGLA
jgi:hypothetical protein